MSEVSDKRTILITGGAGFIGSNFINFFLSSILDIHIVNLDKLTYAGTLENLIEIEKNERYYFEKGDICNDKLVDAIFQKHQITDVIHFAAESHVDNSISAPNAFIETNVRGTFVLLEAARKHWISEYATRRFHHISTDEVYGSLGDKDYFTESSCYAPNSPYSASKAASDFLVRSYHHTYGLNIVTSNCSNNFGPKQHDEKLIPTIIKSAVSNRNIPIYGTGKNVRDWLYVLDHCKAIYDVFSKGVTGETYLIGGSNEYTNIEIAQKICQILDELVPKESGSYKDQIAFVKDRKGHDFRYAIDATKIREELGWEPNKKFEQCLHETIKWYLNKYF